MNIERIRHSGAYQISHVIDGQLVARTYYGYSRREAIALFRGECKRLKGA